MINWIALNDPEQLAAIDKESEDKYILIYKHSTRCGICVHVKDDLATTWKTEYDQQIKTYYLDLLKHRSISNEIEKKYGVRHQSPQVLLIKNGKCIYNDAQFSVNTEDILKAASAPL